MRGMIADCSKLSTELNVVNENDWNEFEWDVFFHMFWNFFKAGDRNSLVKLLATQFPSSIDFVDT
jgi:hypothetical protein